MTTNYHIAEAVGTNLSISNKHAREILKFVKGMNVDKAIKRLNRVVNFEEGVPFRRFNKKIGHRPGIGPGRYPQKACKAIITVLKNAKNNALNKGLQEEKLIIMEGITMMDISKRRRVRTKKGLYVGSTKLTSVRIKITEKEEEFFKKTEKKEAKKEVKKVEKKQPEKEVKKASPKKTAKKPKAKKTAKKGDKK
jgi:ribosomal protein uL22